VGAPSEPRISPKQAGSTGREFCRGSTGREIDFDQARGGSTGREFDRAPLGQLVENLTKAPRPGGIASRSPRELVPGRDRG